MNRICTPNLGLRLERPPGQSLDWYLKGVPYSWGIRSKFIGGVIGRSLGLFRVNQTELKGDAGREGEDWS